MIEVLGWGGEEQILQGVLVVPEGRMGALRGGGELWGGWGPYGGQWGPCEEDGELQGGWETMGEDGGPVGALWGGWGSYGG